MQVSASMMNYSTLPPEVSRTPRYAFAAVFASLELSFIYKPSMRAMQFPFAPYMRTRL